MQEIFRIFQYKENNLYEIAFVGTEESTKFYLDSCNKHNKDKNSIFYFAQKIRVEQ